MPLFVGNTLTLATLALLLLFPPLKASAQLPLHFNLTLPRTALASASLPPNFIFFAGGRTADGSPSRIVDIFNTRTGQHTSGAFLSVARADLAAAAVAFSNGTSDVTTHTS
jgi:hypothetical protein